MKVIPLSHIVIPENRQRKSFDETAQQELVTSIQSKGLLHPLVLRADGKTLVAGERRLRAIADIHELEGTFLHDGSPVPSGFAPYVLLSDLSPLEIEEAELEENLKRVNLSWQEESAAVAHLAEVRASLAREKGAPSPSFDSLSQELSSRPDHVREQIIVAANLADLEIAAAPTVREAYKLLKKKEKANLHASLAMEIGKTFTAKDHSVINGDSEEWIASCPSESFDVILTDPPYGMGADEFGDSNGLAAGAHGYSDSIAVLRKILLWLPEQTWRIAKPQAALYLFCDITWFTFIKERLTFHGWEVFRTPLIWHKPFASRAPWPDGGPQRRYELILFARKGKRPVNRMAGDVIEVGKEENLGHAAQKPVGLFQELLSRSALPGDSVLDLFAGTGPLLPAAHALSCRATVIEKDPISYGICLERAKGLLTQANLLEEL